MTVSASAVFHKSAEDSAGRHASGCLVYQAGVKATGSVEATAAPATVG
jgi:hypothetical protein